jgi:hypothetical protein
MGSAGRPADPRRSLIELRPATAERLRGRREEIHEAVIHRALSVAPPSGREIPGYVEGLRSAIPAAVEYAFDAIEVGEERVGPTPATIFVQAGASARSRVGLEVVMRRYAVGYSTLCDFLHQEVRALQGETGEGYTILLRELTALFDRIVIEVSEAYGRAEGRSLPSPAERRLERIRRLLAGDRIDPEGLEYPLEGHHLSMIVSGAAPEEAAGDLAARLDRRLLIGESPGKRCAVWLGGGRQFEREELEEATGDLADVGIRLSLGEPGHGLAGWRRSRRQAEAAHVVAERGREGVVWYHEVALLAAALRDPDLSHFLIEYYVDPLGGESAALGETLLVFLELNGNASSAAAALGISRQTVASRLRSVEERVGGRIGTHAAQIETALRLAELGN